MRLLNTSKNLVIVNNLERAESLFARLKGLLGRTSLACDSALWIDECSSIHTFFMRFAIDVVFVDSSLKVKKVFTDIQPWRIILPVWGARSVIEFAAGVTTKMQIKSGDQLNVVD